MLPRLVSFVALQAGKVGQVPMPGLPQSIPFGLIRAVSKTADAATDILVEMMRARLHLTERRSAIEGELNPLVASRGA